jgi:putative proteasome-type protease
MTYCAALKLERGIVFGADTRTNAGLDNIAQFRKLYYWQNPGDRVMVLLTAGNLAVSQSVVSILNEQLSEGVAPDAGREEKGGRKDKGGRKAKEAKDAKDAEPRDSLFSVPSMYRAARLVGQAVREVRAIDGPALEKFGFAASFILGGQIGQEPPRLFQIYSEGNFIEATDDTPFLQIGEHKYGKPILDRVARPSMRLGEAAKLLLLSFDSTLRSNLSVGMPLDFLIYERDSLSVSRLTRIEDDNAYFKGLSGAWSKALRESFANIEEFDI